MVYVQGSYNRVSDLKIERLTEHQILDTINNKNVSQIFLKDFNFKDLLGDIRYNSRGEVVGAGAVEMKFYTTGTDYTGKKIFGDGAKNICYSQHHRCEASWHCR